MSLPTTSKSYLQQPLHCYALGNDGEDLFPHFNTQPLNHLRRKRFNKIEEVESPHCIGQLACLLLCSIYIIFLFWGQCLVYELSLQQRSQKCLILASPWCFEARVTPVTLLQTLSGKLKIQSRDSVKSILTGTVLMWWQPHSLTSTSGSGSISSRAHFCDVAVSHETSLLGSSALLESMSYPLSRTKFILCSIQGNCFLLLQVKTPNGYTHPSLSLMN